MPPFHKDIFRSLWLLSLLKLLLTFLVSIFRYSANEFLGLFDKETGHAPTHGPKTPYPNLLEDMVNAKVIASRLYSIYLSGGSLGKYIVTLCRHVC